MSRKYAYLILAMFALLGHAPMAQCQTLYLDSSGDGLNWWLEFLNGNNNVPFDCITDQTTSVDVYLVTDKNPDGTAITCASSAEPLTIKSYQLVLRSVGTGQVVVKGWTDSMGFNTPNITKGDGTVYASGSDAWVGRAGESQPPGKYKLGTLSIEATGHPALFLVTSTTLDGDAYTAFGSACGGVYFPDELLLGGDFPTGNAFPTCYSDPVIPTTWGKIKQQYR